MDASALLKSQGWRGTGFSLHPTDNAIGLAKPLLLSRNTDGRGVGQKPHHTSDQWWLHAFDQKLKGLDTSKKGTVTQAVTQGKLDVVVATGKPGGKYTGSGGLYASFVRGETLVGSMSVREETETPEGSGAEKGETRAEKKARRAARRAVKERERARRKKGEKARRKAERKAAREVGGSEETKEERRARRVERRARKEARRKRREARKA